MQAALQSQTTQIREQLPAQGFGEDDSKDFCERRQAKSLAYPESAR